MTMPDMARKFAASVPAWLGSAVAIKEPTAAAYSLRQTRQQSC